MRTPGDKKATTLRLSPEVKSKLENVARLTRNSESLIAETALTEYFKNHGYQTQYTMTANKVCYALTRRDGEKVEFLDMQIRNGVPLEEVRRTYAARFDSPVELIVDEGADK